MILKENIIEDLIVTAMEGGSNYWYYLPNRKEFEKYHPKGVPLAIAIYKAVKDGATITVSDVEEISDKLGEISWKRIEEAETLLLEKHPEFMAQCIAEEYDAEVADVWFQYVVLKDLVYG